MNFEQEYEKQILATCLRDVGYLQKAVSTIKDFQFSNKYTDWVWKQILSQYKNHHELMPRKKLIKIIKAEFPEQSKAKPYFEMSEELFDTTPSLSNTSMTELLEFRKCQIMKSGMNDVCGLLDQGKVSDAWKIYRESASTPTLLGVDSADWFSKLDERQSLRQSNVGGQTIIAVPTSVRYLDKYTGGLARGELGILIGVTGIGKTSLLVQFAYGGAMRGGHILYVALEMKRQQIETKLDSKLTQLDTKKFKAFDFNTAELRSIEKSRQRIERMPKRVLKDRLHVAAVPVQRCDINIIRGIIHDRDALGIPTDMLIVDSGDHLIPSRRAENIRVAHTMAYWDLKGLAEEHDLGVWSSVHAPKDFKNKIIWHAEAVAESYDKARIADLAVTLGQNLPMSEIEPYPEVAMVLAKNRDGVPPKTWLKMQARYGISTFIEIDEMERTKAQREEMAQ